ncbi:hypothetical protein X772_22180 [Mesorhizobium sp. LSJC280B00]|nr:hypothetical protein X772_22180 [Mesorhizobium sp. LSJC280B00]
MDAASGAIAVERLPQRLDSLHLLRSMAFG